MKPVNILPVPQLKLKLTLNKATRLRDRQGCQELPAANY